MTNRKDSALPTITGADLADGDLFRLVDISDTTDGPSGSSKVITKAELSSVLGVGNGLPSWMTTTDSPNTLTLQVAEGQTAESLVIKDDDGNVAISFTAYEGTYSRFDLFLDGTTIGSLTAYPNGGAAGPPMIFNTIASVPLFLDSPVGTVTTLPTSALADAKLVDLEQNFGSTTGAVVAWLDVAGNKLTFRVVYPDGTTFKTGSVALT